MDESAEKIATLDAIGRIQRCRSGGVTIADEVVGGGLLGLVGGRASLRLELEGEQAGWGHCLRRLASFRAAEPLRSARQRFA